MEYVLLSVLCSVTVSVMLKLARIREEDTSQIIVWNYPVAAILTVVFFKLEHVFWFSTTETGSGGSGPVDVPWGLYGTLAILLPTVFYALAASIRTSGITRTEVAQRLALFIPLMAAFLLFGETLRGGTLAGIGVGILAMGCLIGGKVRNPGNSVLSSGTAQSSGPDWFYLLAVFFGYGVIDVLFKALAQIEHIPYTLSMFIVFLMAMVVAFLYLVYMRFGLGKAISRSAIVWGLGLGIFNFANILFYMKAHRALPENPSIVFTGMNIGVIGIGALAGMLFFGEKLSVLNKIGLILAVTAVLIIAAYM